MPKGVLKAGEKWILIERQKMTPVIKKEDKNVFIDSVAELRSYQTRTLTISVTIPWQALIREIN